MRGPNPTSYLWLCCFSLCALNVGCARKPRPPIPAAKTATAKPAPPVAAAAPRPPPVPPDQLYAKYCALCHGANAAGYAADNAPSLISPTFVASTSYEFLRVAIERGRPGTAMAGYGNTVGGPLTPVEISSLIGWIKIKAAPVLLPTTPITGNVVHGKAVYEKNCASCHGTQMQRLNAVHLFNPMLLSSASDSYLLYAMLNGRPGTKMESWKDKLPEASLHDVVAYLRSFSPAVVPPVMGGEPALPITGPIILNPKGGQAELKLREERFASLDSVKAALDQKKRIVIVDARAPSDWTRLHITGSISVPYYDMKALDKIPNDGTAVVAYCACPHHASGVVVDELRKRGYKRAVVLDEGVFAWQQKGYPVVAQPGVLPVPAPPPLNIGPPKPLGIVTPRPVTPSAAPGVPVPGAPIAGHPPN